MRIEQLTEQHRNGIVSLWNTEWSNLFPMREALITQNVFEDPNWLREGSWVVIEGDRIVGFVTAKGYREELASFGMKPDVGWIQALLVDEAYRGKGIGSELLRKAEEAIRKHGAARISLGNDLHSRIFPGLPEPDDETLQWFETRGYVCKGDVYDMVNGYDSSDTVELPPVQGATLRIADPSDRERLTAFMTRCFPGNWDYQHQQYWNRGGTGREFVLLEKNGDIIGFCRMNDGESPLLAQNIYWAPLFEEPLGGIGPLGIDESYRGYRYGISIVQAAVHYLLERGNRSIVIDTTPYVDFYGKLGFESWRRYARYEKQLG